LYFCISFHEEILKRMHTDYQKHIIDILGRNSDIKFIILGGIHGNEINGIEAIEKILPVLKKKFDPNKGQIYFLKGNLPALEKKERFIHHDLNRLWLDKYIGNNTSEIVELKSLNDLQQLIIRDICKGKYDNCIFLDLHTFSAKSGVFAIPACNAKSLAFAHSFGVPFIDKLSGKLPGTALSYWGKKGMTSMVFEGGTHQTPEATENLMAAIWHSLAYFNLVDDQLPEVIQGRNRLKGISENLPHHLELAYRHQLSDNQKFEMKPGYYNFKPIKKNEALANQDLEIIKSPETGFMLMPLYQKKGSDGFFIVKEKK